MKKIFSLSLVFIMIFSLIGCGKRGTDVEEVTKSGTLRVGVTQFEPMNYKVDGEWTGFDTEFAEMFAAEKLNVEVEFVEIIWEERYNLLEDYTIDCIWNGMTIDTKQQQDISVSAPYALNSQILVMKSDEVSKYKDGYDVKDIKIAVETGSEAALLMQYSSHKDVVYVDTQAETLDLVQNEEVDAALVDSTMASTLVGKNRKYPDLAKSLCYSNDYYGVGLRKNSDLKELIDEFIQDTYDDELLSLAEKYGLTLA